MSVVVDELYQGVKLGAQRRASDTQHGDAREVPRERGEVPRVAAHHDRVQQRRGRHHGGVDRQPGVDALGAPQRHARSRSPSVRGGLASRFFGETRVFRHSGNMANNPKGFEEAVSGFLLSEA